MQVAEGVDEIPRLVAADVRDHFRQQGIRGDVEGNSQKQIRAPLIELAGKPGPPALVRLVDVKLKQQMARRQRHLVDLPDIPRGDDVPPRQRVT